jgi:hypothetical protein
MDLTEDQIKGLNVALNEAEVLGVQFDRGQSRIGVTFIPLWMDANGEVPKERKVLFVFHPIGRFVASYRAGRWDDKNAPVVKFEPEQILERLSEFNHAPIYGWDFIDSDHFDFDGWKERSSFDYVSGDPAGMQHTIDLFQEGDNTILDMRIWFGNFEIFTPAYEPIALQDFIDGGKRAWDAIFAGNNQNASRFAIQTGRIPYSNLDEGTPSRAGGRTHKARE